MASVLEQGVHDLLYSMKGSEDFYIGGTDVGSTIATAGDDSGFKWINGDTWTPGTDGVYKNWRVNQPNHTDKQDCVKVRQSDAFWDDVICTKALNYACQKSA